MSDFAKQAPFGKIVKILSAHGLSYPTLCSNIFRGLIVLGGRRGNVVVDKYLVDFSAARAFMVALIVRRIVSRAVSI